MAIQRLAQWSARWTSSASLLVLAMSACAPAHRAAWGEDPTPLRRPACLGTASATSVLGAAELAPMHHTDLFEAIRALRPTFLRSRTPSPEGVVLVLDGMRISDVRFLHGVRVTDVVEVRRLSGPEATVRYGTGHGAGAVIVRTRGGLPDGGCRGPF